MNMWTSRRRCEKYKVCKRNQEIKKISKTWRGNSIIQGGPVRQLANANWHIRFSGFAFTLLIRLLFCHVSELFAFSLELQQVACRRYAFSCTSLYLHDTCIEMTPEYLRLTINDQHSANYLLQDVSPCLGNPCENGGTCIEGGVIGGYICRCREGYNGENCEGEAVITFVIKVYCKG